MFTEKTTSLPHFEEAKPETLVFELFHLFEQNGRWFTSLEEQCRLLLLSDEEKNAEIQADYAKYQAMSAEEQAADERSRMARLGNFTWVPAHEEFMWSHKLIARNDVVIHAFMLGYSEPGRSNDPNIYVIHRPGDENDYSKVYVVYRDIDRSSALRLEKWVSKPIEEMYRQHCAFETRYG